MSLLYGWPPGRVRSIIAQSQFKRENDDLIMPLLACGINHKTAPLMLRERLAFTPAAVPVALRDLLALPAVNEAVVLSTCNRTELYSDAPDPQIMLQWLAQQHDISASQLAPYCYFHQGQAAIEHILRVAAGLDSMALGEPQILGQLKQAYGIAQQSGAIGKYLERLFQAVFAITKQVRTHTGIGMNPISVAYAAVKLTKQIFADLSKCTALLIGAGDTIELVATHLQAVGVKRLLIANRSVIKAKQLAENFQANAISLADIPVYLKEANIVIAATNSQLPLLGKGAVESAIKVRKRRPMLMVDLAVPRNIEPEVSQLEDVYLYNVDDLQTIVAESQKNRILAAQQAEQMIALQAAHCRRQLQTLDAGETIRACREKISRLAEETWNSLRPELLQGKSTEEIVDTFIYQLTQKILHAPSVQLRQAAYDGQLELLWLARRLFDI